MRERARLARLVNRAHLVMPLGGLHGLDCFLWFGGPLFYGYRSDGRKYGAWDVDTRLDGVATRRTVVRSMNRLYNLLRRQEAF